MKDLNGFSEKNPDSDYRTILGSFVPSRLHLSLIGEESDYRPAAGSPHKPGSEAILVHEQTHYFQTAMTAYGQNVWHSYRAATSYAVNEWIKATQSFPNNRRIPLAYLAKQSKQQLASAVLEERAVKEMLGLLSARTYVSQPNLRLNELGLLLIKEPWQISPTITVNGELYSLQGIDILESHAKFLEGTYSLILNGIPMTETMDPNRIPKRYYYAYQWFTKEVGHERTFDFPLICDLALQAMWTDPPKSEQEWRSAHPGWRFVMLTDALKNLRLTPFSSKKDAIERYSAYTDTLLNCCKYPTLNEMFERTLARFEKPELTNLEARMLAPLRFRSGHPWCGANPFLDLDVWIQMKKQFAAPLQQVGDETSTTIVEGESPPDPRLPVSGLMLENIAELHFNALACQILGQRGRHPPSGTDQVQCGYGYFGIQKGCHYQISDGCPASFSPKQGLPIHMTVFKEEKFEGCSFGAMLFALGLTSEHIDVDFTHRMPTSNELMH